MKNGKFYIAPLAVLIAASAYPVYMPSIIAAATTAAMYCGELILMDGALFRFGRGIFFDPISPLPFAPADILVTLIPGAVTLIITKLLNKQTKSEE